MNLEQISLPPRSLHPLKGPKPPPKPPGASRLPWEASAIDILRLLAVWMVVDTHRRQPVPFSWPLCHMLGTDITRLEDVYIVLTVRLLSVQRLTLRSFAMKALRKVAVQAGVLIAFTHVASFFVRPASPVYCLPAYLFDNTTDIQARSDFAGWKEWVLAAVTMRDSALPVRNNLDSGMMWPTYPYDDFPNGSWPTSTWFVCMEYSIFWIIGAAIAVESALPHLVTAGTVAWIAWMFLDVDHQPKLCGTQDHYYSLWYCRLPAAMLLHCACRALSRCGLSGIPQKFTPLAVAAIGGSLALSTIIEDHPGWKDLGFGGDHCRRHLPFLAAGLPFQFFLLVFTFIEIKLPGPAAACISYLANLNFCIIASHLWIMLFFEKYAPHFSAAWLEAKNEAEGMLFAMQQLFVMFAVAALLHGFVAEPMQQVVTGLADYPALTQTLAFAHLALCMTTWPHSFSYYPLFSYGKQLSDVGPPLW